MKRFALLVILAAQALASLSESARVECRYLSGLCDPKRWSPSECVASGSPLDAVEHGAVRMHVPVDFTAGEKQYPIGWPRMYLNLLPEEQNWHDYDRFEFQLFTETSRTNLPRRPLAFHLYDVQGQKKLITLDQAATGVWKTVALSISDLGLSGSVARLGLNINESDYADKDVIDFHFGGFRLVRATDAQVTELKTVAPALFCDSRVLPVEVVVEGPPEKLRAGLPFRLRCGDRVALSQTLPVARGRQTLYLSLSETSLAAGAYTLEVNPDEPPLKKEISVLIVTSPYRSADTRVQN